MRYHDLSPSKDVQGAAVVCGVLEEECEDGDDGEQVEEWDCGVEFGG